MLTSIAITFGSFSVHTHDRSSPKCCVARPAKSAKRAGTSSPVQPPRPATQRGSVKWLYVTTGVTPWFRQVSMTRL